MLLILLVQEREKIEKCQDLVKEVKGFGMTRIIGVAVIFGTLFANLRRD